MQDKSSSSDSDDLATETQIEIIRAALTFSSLAIRWKLLVQFSEHRLHVPPSHSLRSPCHAWSCIELWTQLVSLNPLLTWAVTRFIHNLMPHSSPWTFNLTSHQQTRESSKWNSFNSLTPNLLLLLCSSVSQSPHRHECPLIKETTTGNRHLVHLFVPFT